MSPMLLPSLISLLKTWIAKTTPKKLISMNTQKCKIRKKNCFRGLKLQTVCLRRLALRRKERKRRTEMAPVRRILAAIWMKEGSSVVERREGEEEYGISMGPSSPSVVIVVMISPSHVSDEGGMAEIEKEVGFLWRKGRREGLRLWLWWWWDSDNGKGRLFEKWRWWWHWNCNIGACVCLRSEGVCVIYGRRRSSVLSKYLVELILFRFWWENQTPTNLYPFMDIILYIHFFFSFKIDFFFFNQEEKTPTYFI